MIKFTTLYFNFLDKIGFDLNENIQLYKKAASFLARFHCQNIMHMI